MTIKIIKVHLIKPVIKIIVIASLGTIFEIAGLFLFPNYQLFLGIVHCIEVPGMMLLLLWKQREYVLKGIVCGYFSVLVMNGVVELLWNIVGSGWFYPLLVLAANVIVVCVTYYVIQRIKMEKGIYPVDIYCPDVIWTAKGYYDSGNRLVDPYTGKGVHIISARLAERLGLKDENKVCVPYQSLGNTQGLIDVYYVDNMKIKKQNQWIEQGRVPLGVADNALFAGKEYEMIMNENVW